MPATMRKPKKSKLDYQNTTAALVEPKQDARSQKPVVLKRRVRPFGDQVLVQPVEETDQITTGGLFIPQTSQNPLKQRREAIVLEVGRGTLASDTGVITPLEMKPGDRVVISEGAGQEIRREGHYLKLIRFYDVLAWIE